jgi:N-acetylmuramoyl-L-alanine amidase
MRLFLVCLLTGAIAYPAYAEAPVKNWLIALDVGHSALRPGAISATGQTEFSYNLKLVQNLDQTLSSSGFPTLKIGFDGKADQLKQRTDVANQAAATLFLSIHHDSVQPRYLKYRYVENKCRHYSAYAAGFSLFVSRKNSQSAASLHYAAALGKALIAEGFHPSPHHAEKIDGENREWADQSNGVYYYDDLVVLKTAQMPSVLLEAGVIVNPKEEQQLQTPETRQRIAKAINYGLQSSLGPLFNSPNETNSLTSK